MSRAQIMIEIGQQFSPHHESLNWNIFDKAVDLEANISDSKLSAMRKYSLLLCPIPEERVSRDLQDINLGTLRMWN